MKSLGEFADVAGGTVRGDAATPIDRLAAVDDVDERSLTFATDARYLREALRSRAAAVLTEASVADAFGEISKPLLIVASTRGGLAAILAAIEPERPRGPYRHPSAVIDPSATIGPDVYIGPLVTIGQGATIGAECVLDAGVVIAAQARVGKRCHFRARSMLLDRCVAGDRVTLQAGAVIGSDGFGYVFVGGRFEKIPQVGIVELADDVEIGANTCIDRAQTGVTSIGTGTKIDNLVQIGHNCRIGAHCALPSQTGIAGSTTVGDYTIIGGQTGVNGHITIGSRVKIAGSSHIWGDVPDDAFLSGRPAQDHRAELRHQVRLRNLEKLYARVAALEAELAAANESPE